MSSKVFIDVDILKFCMRLHLLNPNVKVGYEIDAFNLRDHMSALIDAKESIKNGTIKDITQHGNAMLAYKVFHSYLDQIENNVEGDQAFKRYKYEDIDPNDFRVDEITYEHLHEVVETYMGMFLISDYGSSLPEYLLK